MAGIFYNSWFFHVASNILMIADELTGFLHVGHLWIDNDKLFVKYLPIEMRAALFWLFRNCLCTPRAQNMSTSGKNTSMTSPELIDFLVNKYSLCFMIVWIHTYLARRKIFNLLVKLFRTMKGAKKKGMAHLIVLFGDLYHELIKCYLKVSSVWFIARLNRRLCSHVNTILRILFLLSLTPSNATLFDQSTKLYRAQDPFPFPAALQVLSRAKNSQFLSNARSARTAGARSPHLKQWSLLVDSRRLIIADFPRRFFQAPLLFFMRNDFFKCTFVCTTFVSSVLFWVFSGETSLSFLFFLFMMETGRKELIRDRSRSLFFLHRGWRRALSSPFCPSGPKKTLALDFPFQIW